MGTTEGIGTFVNEVPGEINSLTGYDYTFSRNIETPFWNNMVGNINRGFPVIYTVDSYYFYNGYTQHIGHSVLGNGYNPDGTVIFWDVNPGFNTIWRIANGDMSTALNEWDGVYYVW